MRDAISMLDQCISLSGGEVTAQQVYEMLGTSDRRYFFSLSQAVLAGDTARAMAGLDAMIEGGGEDVYKRQTEERCFSCLGANILLPISEMVYSKTPSQRISVISSGSSKSDSQRGRSVSKPAYCPPKRPS